MDPGFLFAVVLLLLVSWEPMRTWQGVAAVAVMMLVISIVRALPERILRLPGDRVTPAVERKPGRVLAVFAVGRIRRGIKTFVAGL